MLQEAHVDAKSKRDLSPAESTFLAAASEMGFGRFEGIQIRRGSLVLTPFPTAIRTLKFGSVSREGMDCAPNSNLKKQSEEFLELIRGIDKGVIRRLEIRHGLPFSMEIEYCISRGMQDVKGEHVEAA